MTGEPDPSLSFLDRGEQEAIALAEQPMPVTASEEAARMLAEGVARLGIERLPWTKALRQWRDRIMFLRQIFLQQAEGDEWPDLSDPAIAADVDGLASFFSGVKSAPASATSSLV